MPDTFSKGKANILLVRFDAMQARQSTNGR